MNGVRVRRDIVDLLLEALDVARSRRLAWHDTQTLIFDMLAVERPDIPLAHAPVLVARAWRRLARVPMLSPEPAD